MTEFRKQKSAAVVKTLTVVLLALGSAIGCSSGGGSGGGGSSAKPIAAYCPYLPSKTISGGVTLTGDAFYEYRKDGNGVVSDSIKVFTTALTTTPASTVQINGTTLTSCTACSAATSATTLVAAINAASVPVTASASGSSVTLTPKNEGDAITLVLSSDLSLTDGHPDPAPIKRAEVAVVDGGGNIVQCGETNETGQFSFSIPSGGSYTVKVLSRANNAFLTGYIMNDPTNNEPYALTASVSGTGSPTVRLLAKATTAGIEGGAFNILDQIYNAQKYLRSQTAGCNSAGANYFPDCDPFVSAPIVKTYWKAGISPGIYQGISGGISFYLNGKMELYILGGVNGDTNSADMDHYDNSVIVHEYGHFIEDQFGNPNSPGGSHNGNAIIDPRLAWGEGWANFFQAAVSGNAVYRDTYGHLGCTGAGTSGHTLCTGVAFNEDLDPTACGSPHSGMSSQDCPSVAGEGNFHEFSVSRALYDVAKVGSGLKFSEIWNALHGPTLGMKVVADGFKSIGRLHKIQQTTSGHTDWYSLRNTELQSGDASANGTLANYGTPITLGGCSSTSAAMSIKRGASDDGSFAKSNQFMNNDFYVLNWPGGVANLSLTWGGGTTADLDLYLYKAGYTFGSSASMAGFANADSSTTSGTEATSINLPAGQYMINVMAYTGIYNSTTTTYTTTYNLTVNGQAVCPAP